ncbi:MAG: putative hydro-lyase [Pseudomonadota bacterium]
MNVAVKIKSGAELRRLARSGEFTDQTAGQAPDHLQANVVILALKHAGDFLQYCLNNPKPCPLIGLSRPGETGIAGLGTDIDIRKDIPRYRIYRDGVLSGHADDITELWSDDLVTFVLGCSFTFEEALIRAGFGVRHIEQRRNVPMFKTGMQTMPGGVFHGPLVVTMRPYRADLIPSVFDLCAKYPHAHGTPVFWGNPADIGIADLQSPDYGDPVDLRPGEVPVFWACGVTPQAAIEAAKPSICITHAPGHMLVTDVMSDAPPKIDIGMADLQIERP